MTTWQENQLHALLSVECEDKLFCLVVSIGRELGFDHCAYGLRMPLPLTQPKLALFNNYPIAWQNQYQERNYIAADPTVQHGMRSTLPVIWTESLFSSARELWEDAQSFGLKIGWAQSSRDINNASGMLTLARAEEPISEMERQANECKMTWLAQATHSVMAQRLTPKLLPESMIQLSPREIEVLKWTGDGKTSSEISDILNISERTVNFHIGNAITKLNTPNKTAAVIRAAMMGILK
ncbi:autoinducer binding domain-containing protein [Sulfuriferula nivalis]|uniref:LuxR family transcriptional regulator n=1 Tax=Sulfuriferula nivalis TaxID=2675298 RepID=A0A809RM70_9PROT|nr:autoinducer binding domain-containing protein [Sulfuriferula nivalis]BBP02505.1 LuxR family transcriptional regulator [Sulfuriferula nivalis]